MRSIGNWLRSAWIVLLVAGVVILLDQWTKELVRQSIPKFTHIVPIPALGEYFVFEHVDNYGAAFGILQSGGNLFVIIAAAVTVAILVYVRNIPPQQHFVRVMLGLMLGGAIGNAIDRLQQGFVTDFVKMGIPGVYYWPNYNIADSAIVIGVIGLGGYILIEDFRASRRARAKPQEGGTPGAASSPTPDA
jgi:signal peptidase II